ncbi:hypothetical protein [Halobacteriovorax sp. HLS]|uniref:hypothetical protein n=1 Tax=Halobacteriovorax sp. HLS TaxID=2234000 RepID=UPI000FD960E0|nr:hypothetical protein [Halobacteriovorax sp. HLS]
MSFIKDFYHCYHCKQEVSKLEDLLFVEAGSTRSFCGEKCIEDYFKPITDQFEAREKELRKKYAVETESCLDFLNDISVMEAVMTLPDEIWCLENGIQEEIFSFIKKIEHEGAAPFYAIVLCTIFDTYPGFVLLSTITESKFLMEEFRIGEQRDVSSHFEDDTHLEDNELGVTSSDVETIEKKKSELLAKHLENISIADIPVEKYELYDEYLATTMQNPDEVYKKDDEQGDTLYTYIKAYDKEGVSFYYFVICIRLDIDTSEGEEIIVPVFTFPSVDGDLYRLYHDGEQVSGPLKN